MQAFSETLNIQNLSTNWLDYDHATDIQTAIARASAWYQRREFERIVSDGDAVWDVNTARQLDLPFLGVAAEPRATLLRDNGAGHIIEHFLDQGQCLQLLDDAIVPRQILT